MIMSMLAIKHTPIDPNDVPLASLIAQEKDQVDVNFLARIISTTMHIKIILLVTIINLILLIMVSAPWDLGSPGRPAHAPAQQGRAKALCPGSQEWRRTQEPRIKSFLEASLGDDG